MLSFQSSKIKHLPEMEKLFKAALMKTDMSFDYPDPSGNKILREQIKTLHPHWEGEVLITNSATEATYLALSQFSGKTLALNVPSYFGVIRQAKELGIKVKEWKTVEELENLSSVDVILLTSNFTPPTGKSFSDHDKLKIAEYANAKDVTVIEDNAYELLSYSEGELTSINSNKVIRINSFSKILTPSLRMGFVIASDDFFSKMRSNKITINLSSSSISQSIISEILKDQMIVGKWQKELMHRAKVAQAAIEEYFHQKVKVSDGGAFLKLDLDESIDVSNFIKFAKENGVLIDDNKNQYMDGITQSYVRLHLGSINKEDINKAIETISKYNKKST